MLIKLDQAFYQCLSCGHIRQYGNRVPPFRSDNPKLKCKGCLGQVTPHVFRYVKKAGK